MTNDQLILNRYRPIGEAGAGGFATVQIAWDTRIQRRVAIKCIRLSDVDSARVIHSGSPSIPEGISGTEPPHIVSGPLPQVAGLDEARTAAMLSDASIVGVYDFEVQGQNAYLIMEYVDGLTLTSLLREFGDDLTLDAVATIFASVASALEVAHDNQVLHLDIKPDNVLINRQGQVKVTDFGLAKLSDAAGFGSASGGTIGYMPPEQMRQESLDARCDEWALASMTYEVLVGANPFLADDIDHAIAAVEDAELVLPSLCFNGLSPAADDILFTALDPEREERYRSVADFSEEMLEQLGDSNRGRKELAILVGQAREDFEEEKETIPRISVFDRLGDRGRAVISRIWSVLSVGFLGVVSLANIPAVGGFTSPVLWGLLALFVLAAAFKPHLGAALGLLAFSVALFSNEAYLAGIALVVAAGLWWFFVGRKGDNQANTALSPVLFGSFGCNQITPLLSGFFLSVREALITTLFAALLSLMLASFGSDSLSGWNVASFWSFGFVDVQHNMVVMMTRPQTWCIIVSWLISSLLVSIFCLRQTRLFAGIGVVISVAVLFGGVVIGAGIATGFTSWMPSWTDLAVTAATGVAVMVMCGFGVPIRRSADEE